MCNVHRRYCSRRHEKRNGEDPRSLRIFSGIDNVFHDARGTMILSQAIIIFLGRERSRKRGEGEGGGGWPDSEEIVRSREESIMRVFEKSGRNGLKLKFRSDLRYLI